MGLIAEPAGTLENLRNSCTGQLGTSHCTYRKHGVNIECYEIARVSDDCRAPTLSGSLHAMGGGNHPQAGGLRVRSPKSGKLCVIVRACANNAPIRLPRAP